MGKRINYLDYAKGIAIFGVVFGHVYGFKNIISIWFFSFHVPMFFIVSGILTTNKKNKFKNILIKNIKTILIPYFCFSIPFIFINISGRGIVGFKESILKILTGYGLGALWFLPTLFISLSIFKFLLLKIDKRMLYFISILILIVPFFIKSDVLIIDVILRAFIAFGFIAFGYSISQLIKKENINIIIGIIMISINIVATIFNGVVDLYSLNFGNPIMYVLQGVTGSLGIIIILMNIKSIKIDFLSKIGENTLIIMSTHQILLMILTRVGLNNTIVFILICLLEIPIVYIVNNYFSWVIGRTNQNKFRRCKKNMINTQ